MLLADAYHARVDIPRSSLMSAGCPPGHPAGRRPGRRPGPGARAASAAGRGRGQRRRPRHWRDRRGRRILEATGRQRPNRHRGNGFAVRAPGGRAIRLAWRAGPRPTLMDAALRLRRRCPSRCHRALVPAHGRSPIASRISPRKVSLMVEPFRSAQSGGGLRYRTATKRLSPCASRPECTAPRLAIALEGSR